MTSRLDRHASTLKLLSRANQKMPQNILKSAGDDLIKRICDCTLNVLKGNVRVSKAKVEAKAAQKSFARSCKEKSQPQNVSGRSFRKVVFGQRCCQPLSLPLPVC